MIRNVGGGNPMLALLQARTAAARSATGAPKSEKEIEAAKAKDEKRQQAEDVLRTLRQVNADGARQRKAAAKQKVDRLKKELESLRMFSAGDPKAIARQAARIARELGAAAKEYGSAGGGAAVGGASPAASNGEANAASDSGKGAEAVAAAATVSAEAGASSAEDAADKGVEAAAAEAEKVAADAEAKAGAPEPDAKTNDADKDKSGKPLTREEERAALVDELNQAVGESERRAGESAADKKFANDVRNLFNQARAMVEQQRRRAAAENRDDKEFEQFSKEVAAAGDEIDQAFSGGGLELGVVMAQAPVNITV